MLRKAFCVTGRSVLNRKSAWKIGNTIDSTRNCSVYEPDYLDSLMPTYPQYQGLDVSLKGYDYPVLECYQRFLHSTAEYMDIDVLDCYALPPKQTEVHRLRPNSTIVETKYELNTYERHLHLGDVDAIKYPIFLRLAIAAQPEGVHVTVREHNGDCEEQRYVPDKDLLELKQELEKMQSSKKKKDS